MKTFIGDGRSGKKSGSHGGSGGAVMASDHVGVVRKGWPFYGGQGARPYVPRTASLWIQAVLDLEQDRA